jgi:tetratricopeptide (TPR) repeat protein
MRSLHRSNLVCCVLGMTVVAFCGLAMADTPAEPHFQGLGTYTRKITTHSPESQKYFDQGLAFLCGFNHDEAIRSFQAAAASDPGCAMVHWGIAMANGPHINNTRVDRSHAKAAWKSLEKARELAPNASPVERALIEALAARYADPQPVDRKPLGTAYAAAMRKVWHAYPDDADVGALTAEALMDLRPWDQWTLDGKSQPGTEEVLAILDAVLAKTPRHPLALHLMIHANEASPHPERAAAAADRLRDLEPGIGHLVHMPSHIDIRRGRWQEAVVANEKAIAADKAYQAAAAQQGSYRVYMAHNHHMLAYAAMMQGESLKATQAIQGLLSDIPQEFRKKSPALVDRYVAMPYELHLRFGRWDEMLAEPQPEKSFPIASALRHYARGVAFAAKSKLDSAKSEQQAFLDQEHEFPSSVTFSKNKAIDFLGIAEKMLEGEILYREGKTDAAVAALREAVRREDHLHYIEPPAWIQPSRHTLGATLMDAKRYADAETVYRDDLAHYPENGWSLYGLSRSLRLQGKTAEALTVSMRFDKAWQHADVELKSSCYCLQGIE